MNESTLMVPRSRTRVRTLILTHVIVTAVAVATWIIFVPHFAQELSQMGLGAIFFLGLFYFLRFALLPYIVVSTLLVFAVVAWRFFRRIPKDRSNIGSILLVPGLHILTVVLLFVLPKPYVEIGLAGGLPASTRERCPAEAPIVTDNPDSPPPYTEEILWAQQFGYYGSQESYQIRSTSDSEGNVYLAGVVTYDGNQHHCHILKETGYVVRYAADGEIDTSWAEDGFKVFRSTHNSADDFIEDVAVDDRDNFYVLWISEDQYLNPIECRVQKFLPNGQLDLQWGNEGTVDFWDKDYYATYTKLNRGRILCPRDMHADGQQLYLLGATGNPAIVNGVERSSHGFVMKLDEKGRLDAAWGNNGVVIPDRSTGQRNAGYRAALMVDRAGNLIAETNSNEFVRLLPNGEIDSTWGDGGLLNAPEIQYANNLNILQAPNGRIMVAEISEPLADDYEHSENPNDYNVTLSWYDPESNQLTSDEQITIVPKMIIEDPHLAVSNEYVYISGRDYDEDFTHTFVEKYGLTDGKLITEWGDEGVKKYGSMPVSESTAGMYVSRAGDVVVFGTTDGNLGGPSCNGPHLSCGTSYGYVVKMVE